jgi:hypothetical protein
MAYQRGKSEGNMAVLYELEELVDLLITHPTTKKQKPAVADDDPTEIRLPEPFNQSEWRPVEDIKKGKKE